MVVEPWLESRIITLFVGVCKVLVARYTYLCFLSLFLIATSCPFSGIWELQVFPSIFRGRPPSNFPDRAYPPRIDHLCLQPRRRVLPESIETVAVLSQYQWNSKSMPALVEIRLTLEMHLRNLWVAILIEGTTVLHKNLHHYWEFTVRPIRSLTNQ